MNIKPQFFSRLRFWTWPWFWSVTAATALVCFAAPTVAREDSGSDQLKDCIQLAIAFMAIATLPHLVWYEMNYIYRHPPRRRPSWYWLLLSGVFIGVIWNAYFVWNSMVSGKVGSPMSVGLSLLAWSVSLLLLSFTIRLLRKIFRWLWVDRRRYWIWLGVWSLMVATVTIISSARSRVFTHYPYDERTVLIRQEVGFVVVTMITLMLSYLVIFTCRNLPRDRKTWFWLALAGISSAILWTSFLIWSGTAKGVAFGRMQTLIVWLAGAVFFLFLAAFLHALRNFFRWLFSWRIVKRGLLAVMGLILLVLAFYAEENWRGKRAWENYRREWEAKGEKFDLLSYAPPSVPDDQNFAMAPIVATSYEWLLDKSGHRITPPKTNIVNRMALDLERINYYFPTNRTIGSWQQARLTDLKPWQDYYRATTYTNNRGIYSGGEQFEIIQLDTNKFPIASQPQSPAADVLLALSRYDAAIAELRQAGERPFSRFPLNYQDGNAVTLMLPHLGSLKRSAEVLQLRAIAELQAGQTESALADVMLMLRLEKSIHDEPTLISHLVRVNLADLAMQPVWEGLAGRRWTDAQMQELGRQLEKLDLVADLQFAMQAERVSALGYIEFMREHRDQYSIMLLFAICPRVITSLEQSLRYLPRINEVSDWLDDRERQSRPHDFFERIVEHLPPAGWYDLNKVTVAKTFQERLFQTCQPAKHLISQQAAAEMSGFMETLRQPRNINPQNALAFNVIPAINAAEQKTALVQSAADMAIVACALDRYHLAQGEYPESLAELAPEYLQSLPPDVVDGQPLHYRRTQIGRYLLYSVGWNGTDDGGVLGRDDFKRVRFHLGDWVWRYPAK